jgi:hypothetical protein
MRRFATVLFLLSALVAAVAAANVRAAADDGTLSVKDGNGVVQVRARGGVMGRVTRGSVQLTDVNEGDGGTAMLKCDNEVATDRSDSTLDPDDTVKWCTGSNIRFRLVGGSFRLFVTGVGVNVSVVGKGRVTLVGKSIDPGLYSVNDSEYVELPLDRLTFELDAAATTSTP